MPYFLASFADGSFDARIARTSSSLSLAERFFSPRVDSHGAKAIFPLNFIVIHSPLHLDRDSLRGS